MKYRNLPLFLSVLLYGSDCPSANEEYGQKFTIIKPKQSKTKWTFSDRGYPAKRALSAMRKCRALLAGYHRDNIYITDLLNNNTKTTHIYSFRALPSYKSANIISLAMGVVYSFWLIRIHCLNFCFIHEIQGMLSQNITMIVIYIKGVVCYWLVYIASKTLNSWSSLIVLEMLLGYTVESRYNVVQYRKILHK